MLPENLVTLPMLSGRSENTDITELAQDIEANNQLQPVVVWKNDAGWPVLAAGHRRYRALSAINAEREKKGEEKLRIMFNYIPARNEQEAFDYTVRENRNRANPTPLDDAYNMHVYQTKFGLGIDAIVKKYFPMAATEEDLRKATIYVKDTLSLLELSDTAKEELRAGFFAVSAAKILASMPSRKTQDETIAATKAAGKTKLKVEDAIIAKKNALGKPVKSIAENSPSARLKRANEIVGFAVGLASEMLGEDPNPEVYMDLARTVFARTKEYDPSMIPAGSEKATVHLIKEPVLA